MLGYHGFVPPKLVAELHPRRQRRPGMSPFLAFSVIWSIFSCTPYHRCAALSSFTEENQRSFADYRGRGRMRVVAHARAADSCGAEIAAFSVERPPVEIWGNTTKPLGFLGLGARFWSSGWCTL